MPTILIFFLILIILLYFLRKRFKGGVCENKHDMTNKVIIITGSSNGIGKESALDLLNHNATVIFACRSEERAMKVINTIPENIRKNAIFMKLDVSNFTSIVNFANEIKKKFKKIDILMNNAGSMPLKPDWTEDGYDPYFVSNYIGPFLLTSLLLPVINKDSGESKVINVSSAMHMWPKIEKGEIQNYTNKEYMKNFYGESKTNGLYNVLYNNTKLFIIYMTSYFALLCEKNNLNIKNVSLHPGLVRSDFFEKVSRANPFVKAGKFILQFIINFFTKNAVEGAQTQLYLSYEKNSKLINGGYYSDCKITKTGLLAINEDLKNEVINWTIDELKNKYENEEDIQNLEYYEIL